MSSDILRTSRSFIAIFMIAVLPLVLACGSESPAATSTAPETTAETATSSPPVAKSDPIEPPLVNTPGPVTSSAPDFTLPSIQGSEYTLSQFRGEKPVVVVFYRAYW